MMDCLRISKAEVTFGRFSNTATLAKDSSVGLPPKDSSSRRSSALVPSPRLVLWNAWFALQGLGGLAPGLGTDRGHYKR